MYKKYTLRLPYICDLPYQYLLKELNIALIIMHEVACRHVSCDAVEKLSRGIDFKTFALL